MSRSSDGSAGGDAGARLTVNRGLILERALVVGAVGMIPVPALDDLLTSAVRKTLLRRLAAVRQVGLDEEAAEVLAEPLRAEVLDAAARVAVGWSFLRRRLRRLALALRVAERIGDSAGTFALATLFDHYCATHHVGLGLDAPRARLLRRAIEASVVEARGSLARRGLVSAGRNLQGLVLRLPAAVLRRRDRESVMPELVAPAEAARQNVQLVPRGLLRRGLATVTGSIADAGDEWVVELVRAFDARWQAG